jgi:hypothetical protein
VKGVSTIPSPNWKNLKQRNEEGDYDLIEPLDYLILAELPEKGTLMGGYYPLATSSKSLKKRFPELTSSLISTRLRLLHMQELAVPINTANSKNGWQRTKKGKELVEAWQQQQQA